MATSNVVFFGCNYNDKKIKAQFDKLKKRIESATPLACIVVDKRAGKSARDLWRDIRTHIEESAACVFDLTGFRPNVVLELGYALSIKSEDQIFITFRKRRSRGTTPAWILSDIGHLQRHEYINVPELETFVRAQLDLTPFSRNYDQFIQDCQGTNAADKYRQNGKAILQAIRDDGSKTKQQIQAIMAGSACRLGKMVQLLQWNGLLHRPRGRNGRYSIPILSDGVTG
jgi:hypothetical protein